MKTTLYQKHPDLFRIVSWGGMILLGILAIVVIAWYGTRPKVSTTYYDDITGMEFTAERSGGITEGISYLGNQLIKDLDVDTLKRAEKIIEIYSRLIYPDIETYSVKNGSVTSKDNTHEFTLVSNTGQNFQVKITDNKDGQTVFTLSDQNNEILNYDSRKIRTSALDPSTFAKKYLPQYFQYKNLKYSVKQNKDSTYQININSCGDQSIKDGALADVKAWIKTLGYDPDDFEFKIPDYCDGSMRSK